METFCRSSKQTKQVKAHTLRRENSRQILTEINSKRELNVEKTTNNRIKRTPTITTTKQSPRFTHDIINKLLESMKRITATEDISDIAAVCTGRIKSSR